MITGYIIFFLSASVNGLQSIGENVFMLNKKVFVIFNFNFFISFFLSACGVRRQNPCQIQGRNNAFCSARDEIRQRALENNCVLSLIRRCV